MKKTAILATAKGYTPEQVRPWVETLKSSGYDGKVFIIMYNKEEVELEKYFVDNGFTVEFCEELGITHIATQRFINYANLLSSDKCKDVDMVIHTDIRDVIFQENPDTWLRNHLRSSHHILATSEGITYNHEDWNGDGLQAQFGETVFQKYKDYETLCSGIIAGRKHVITELFKLMYDLAFYSAQPDGFIDQHFYNLAIRESFSKHTHISSPTETWNINFGTMVAIPLGNPNWSTGDKSIYSGFNRERSGSYNDNLLYDVPQLIDGKVCNELGVPYTIVHQYDRYPEWSKQILETCELL